MDAEATGSGPEITTDTENPIDDIVEQLFADEIEPSNESESAEAAEEQPETSPDDGQQDDDLSQTDTEEEPAEAEESEESDEIADDDEPADEAEVESPEMEAPWTPKMQEAFDKRIGKEVAKRKALEERLQALESNRQTDENSPAPAQPAASPLDRIEDPNQLAQQEETAENVVSHVERQLDVLEEDPDGVERWLKSNQVNLPDYEPATMRAHLRDVRQQARDILRQAPRRREALREQAAYRQQAEQTFTWLSNAESPEAQSYHNIVQKYPGVKSLGNDWPVMVGVVVEGLKAVKARQALAAKPKAAKPKATPPAPPRQPRGTAQPPPRQVDPQAAAKKRFLETGNIDDLADSLSDDL